VIIVPSDIPVASSFAARRTLLWLLYIPPALPYSSSSSASSNGLPFEHLAHGEFSGPQSVAHYA
jgi:hypothetical protein